MPQRRRYWLWIAWGGVALLLLVCALAVWTGPRRFQFVQRGRVFEAYVTGSQLVPGQLNAVTRYDIDSSFDSVAAEALKELPPSEGWVWDYAHSQHVARRASTKEMVVVSQSILWQGGKRTKGPIVVFHHRRASFLDRLLLQKR